MLRKTRALINLAHIKSNYLLANQWAPNSKNVAVIKADAYGHGLVEVARHLESTVSAFAVAMLDEAVLLRQSGVKNDILVLHGLHCSQQVEYAARERLWITVHSIAQLETLARLEKSRPTFAEGSLSLWLQIDTGMHRLGLNSQDFFQALAIINKMTKTNKLVNGEMVVYSHFSCSNEIDNNETLKQITRFNDILSEVKLPLNTQFSLANSAALAHYKTAQLDWNRPGIMLYGLPLFNQPHSTDAKLKAAMSFESIVIAVRDVQKGEPVGYGSRWTAARVSKIATIEVGYADGYPRHATNGTPVLIKGQRAKLAGTVSMDLISVDVTDLDNVQIGDPVELWGEHLSANEVAQHSDTIGYDLLAGVSKRVPRVYR